MKDWSKLKKAAVISAVGVFGIAGLSSMNSPQKSNVDVTPSPTSEPTAVQSENTVAEPQAEPTPTPQPIPTPHPASTPAPSNNCDPNYSGACVPIASDVDCAGGSGNGPAYVAGPVHVIGTDIYGLDRDGDGVACE
jgi:hypothetical protein